MNYTTNDIRKFLTGNQRAIRAALASANSDRNDMGIQSCSEDEIHSACQDALIGVRAGSVGRGSLEQYVYNYLMGRGAGQDIGAKPIRADETAAEKKEREEHEKQLEKKRKEMTYQPGQDIMEFVTKCVKATDDQMRKKWLNTFANCVLPPEVKEVIQEALTVVLRADVFESWGLSEQFEKGLTNSILLYGPPGTGKTMIAESFAAVLDKNLLKVTSADIDSQIPGQDCRNIQEQFQKAKDNNAVIMFDECDSLLYNREAVGMIIGKSINELLTQIERFDGVVILTTNRLGRLDDALQRRIVAKIELPLPKRPERLQIWKNLIPKKLPVGKMDWQWLADQELSGGEIKNSILLAARKAIAANADKVLMKHFKGAVEFVLKSKEDFADAKPKGGWLPGMDVRMGSSMGMAPKRKMKVSE